MATTIQQAFQQLKSNLEITSLQEATVSTRQQNVREVLDDSLDVIDSFLTGSYIRSTMISPLKDADIDIFVVLDPRYYHHYNGQNGGPAGLLDYVKRTLLKTYASTPDISRSGQAVTIRFTDFIVDVVPGFNRQNGGYLIANSITNSWISTDPKRHVDLVTARNKAQSGNFVPVIKMIKGWNKKDSAFFRSFHLEVLALHIFSNVTISDYPSGLRFYFDKGRSLVKQQIPDPAGYGGDIGGYLNTSDKRAEAERRFQSAYDRTIKAEEQSRQGYISQSMASWAQVFGDYFPAYG